MSSLKVGGARADDLIKDDQKRFEFSYNEPNPTPEKIVEHVEWIADVRTDEGLRIREGGLSPCLTASKNSSTEISRSAPLIKKEQHRIRRLTPLECLRLQGFEDVFFKTCKDNNISDTQLYKQAGNSMSVNVIKGIITQILKNEKRNF